VPYKVSNLILDRSARQVSFYDKGLGTGWRKATGNVLGRGFSENVKQCYEFIFENFQEGDEIFLVGFSRGAATVRSLGEPRSSRRMVRRDATVAVADNLRRIAAPFACAR